jgi:hexosaminidase
MKAKTLLLVSILLLSGSFLLAGGTDINIVPKPMKTETGKGKFTFKPSTEILTDAGNRELKQLGKLMVQKIGDAGGPRLQIGDFSGSSLAKNALILTLRGAEENLSEEGYTLSVTKKNIIIRAKSGKGLFYGLQSLFQLLPSSIEAKSDGNSAVFTVKSVEITDMPRYPYRGMHMDVCRHIFPVETIKTYLDIMAMYKMNTFHWHLTDDQGWRIEIKKYPELTKIGSVRKGTQIGRTDENDGVPYGGFYTQEQIRDVVAYAASKYITVIPEIEMPGHAVAALTAFPRLSCTGGPFEVRTQWGVADDIFCAGNDEVFDFVQDILTEVMDLFPSKYIHVGGDEAPKTRWEACPKCQARMKTEGLKDEMELQSYFIKRIERFVSSKGRRIIGWDEILEGGLAPEATVMSWRGVQGGIDAAMQNHDVIMTPVDNCYFDYYQADPATEPLAIGGYVTLKNVYSYEPTPPVLNDQQAKHILGAQGNVWTEYIATPEYLQYMAFPRGIALAEVTWSQKADRNWDDFSKRMQNQYERLDIMGINYSKGSFKTDITTVRDSIHSRNLVKICTEAVGYDIRYTTDGSIPTSTSSVYPGPFSIEKTSTIKAVLAKNGVVKGSPTECEIVAHKAAGKPVTILKPYSFKYPGTGENSLTDGLQGGNSFKVGWQGYEGTDMEIIIDLQNQETINSINTTFVQDISAWVMYPTEVKYFTSIDGSIWNLADTFTTEPLPSKSKADRDFTAELKGITARYIKVAATNTGKLPKWHENQGQPCWMFADEVIVN